MSINFRSLISASLLFLSNTAVFAAADFYGVKMTSEYAAKDLKVNETGAALSFDVEKPGMDKRIYATAALSGRNLRIQIFNRSDETIQSDTDYAEYTVVTHDGQRHVLKPQSMAWNSSNTIAPNKSASFEPSFEGRALKKEEIRAIICSFELGDMKVILLPLTKQRQETKAAAPVKSESAKKTDASQKKSIETAKSAPKKTEEKKPPEKTVAAKPAPVAAPMLKKATTTEPVPAAKRDVSLLGQQAGAAISGGKKTEVSPENENKILDQYEKSRRSRKYWHVEEVRQGFIVINLGTNDGLKPGASVQIAREGAFLAQATVRQSSQGYATASLPSDAIVQAGDDVLFFDATA